MRAAGLVMVVGGGGCYSGLDGGRGGAADGADDGVTDGADDGAGDDEPISEELEPAPARLRLLLSRQYVHAVRDLFGDAAAAVAAPPADVALNGFDAIGASQLSLGDAEVDAYEASAGAVAEVAMTDPSSLAAIAGCTPTGPNDEACLADFVAELGRRAFRRPMADDELARYVGVGMTAAADFSDMAAGQERVIAAILQSPYFLYQVEIGEPDASVEGRRRLTGYEMATRMSLLLADTIPDVELLDAAAAGELDTADGIRGQAERLIASEPAQQAFADFISEFLRLRELPELPKDPALFPEFTPLLTDAMWRETLALVDDVVWARDADFTEVFDAPYTFVDSNLASLYGIPNPETYGDTMTKVTLPPEQKRGGLFGHAGLLSALGHIASTSPTIRGKFVRENIMCTAVPPPPPGVITDLPDTSEAKTMRQRLEAHMGDPTCAGCHAFIDPIGFGLENYDAIGRFRTEENGEPIDAVAEVDGVVFEGAAQLGALVRADPRSAGCIVRSLFRHGTGHLEVDGEEAEIAALETTFADEGFRMQAMLVELVASPAFRVVGEPDA
jgi:hypothetical protein